MKTNLTTFSCKLTPPELRKRKNTVIKELKDIIQDRTELTNGFAYSFSGTDEVIDLITEFVKAERECCDFFDFIISINHNGTCILNITGEEGIKAFIENELGF